MILNYSIENFKSILVKEEISFIAKKNKNSNISLINNEILPVISIYGPNGGGKSTIIHSISILIHIINGSFIFDAKGIERFSKLKSKIDDEENTTKWSIILQTKNDKIFKYELSVDEKIKYERLSIKNGEKFLPLFTRKKDSVQFSGKLKIKKLDISSLNYSLISYLRNITNDEDIVDFCTECKKIMVFQSNNVSPLLQVPLMGFYKYNFNPEIVEKYKKEFMMIFDELDLNIVDVEILRNPISREISFDIVKKKPYQKTYKISFSEESDGTQKVIQLMTLFISQIHDGMTFIIDELDTQLHPKLLGYIIKMFYKDTKSRSQLLYTSHDMYTMSNEYFRKDQIYFAALNESYFTNLVCLHNFGCEIREKTSFSKKYLDGELGYDPYITYGMG